MRHTGVRRMVSKREPSEKQIFKTKAKAFVESISRKCFGRHYKSLTVTRHERRSEIKYRLTTYNQTFNTLHKFHDELIHRFKDFKVTYKGDINSKTRREEWFIEIIVFGDLETKASNESESTKPYSYLHSERAYSGQEEVCYI